jgi:hypothetical protein
MTTLKIDLNFWMIGAGALAASALIYTGRPAFQLTQRSHYADVPAQTSSPTSGWTKTVRGVSDDEMRQLTKIVARIKSMMTVDQGVKTGVWSDAVSDPEGHIGIFMACSQPMAVAINNPGLDMRKSWVILAVLAAVKYTEDSPVIVNYIAFTDPLGLSSERWFYKLDMSAASLVRRDILSGRLSMEQGYDKIVASWRRVTHDG